MENKNIILLGILLLLIFAGGGTGIYFYIDSKKCKPKCKECGDDGCGGDCGSCPTGSSCDKKSGLCVAKKNNNCSCKDKTCGFDGCDKSCGTVRKEKSVVTMDNVIHQIVKVKIAVMMMVMEVSV